MLGTIEVRFALFDIHDNIEEGIEIRGEGINIDLVGYYDIEELTEEDVEDLIEKYND
ncbi:MAG: hypothetical protein KDH96_04745 [Candidatus Riesia sp.]|nr:hypothetical protein [Candidatus Riesia sp.]